MQDIPWIEPESRQDQTGSRDTEQDETGEQLHEASHAPVPRDGGDERAHPCQLARRWVTVASCPAMHILPRRGVTADAPRQTLQATGAELAGPESAGGDGNVQTAVVADLPFPLDPTHPGCVIAGR